MSPGDSKAGARQAGVSPEALAHIQQRLEEEEFVDLEEEIASHQECAVELREELTSLHRGLRALGFATTTPPPFPARIGGYRLNWRIGRGGEGASVFSAVQETTRQVVALKVLPPNADARQVRRFVLQRQFAALHHQNVVPVFDAGESEGFHFLAMDLMAGGSLASLVDALRRASPERLRAMPAGVLYRLGLQADRIPPAAPDRVRREAHVRWAAAVARDVALALRETYAEGLIHRDVKPSNILLAADGSPKLADFGLARQAAGSDVTLTGETLGTRPYMSPEQVACSSALDHRTDLYSLGATLYELLTLHRPLDAPSEVATSDAELIDRIRFVRPIDVRRRNPAVPADLATLVGKLLEKEPRDRVQTAAEVAAELQRFLDGKPMSVRPIGWPTRLLRLARRHPRMWKAIAAAGVVAVISGTWVALTFRQRSAVHAATQDLFRTATDSNLAACREAIEQNDSAAAERAAVTGTTQTMSLLRSLTDRERIDECLCDLAELALVKDDTRAARDLLDLVRARSDQLGLRRRVLDLRSRALLLSAPTEAPHVLRELALLHDPADRARREKIARLVEHLAPENRLKLPGIIDLASAWSRTPVPYVTRPGVVGLWQWQGAEQPRGHLPPHAVELVGHRRPSWQSTMLVDLGQGPDGLPVYHCLLFVKNRLLRFAVPMTPQAQDVEVPVEEVRVGKAEDVLVVTLTVLAADANHRPQRVYVATKGNDSGGQRSDYDVDLARSPPAIRVVAHTNASTNCVAEVPGKSNCIMVGLGEWGGFGFAYLQRDKDEWSLLGMQRIGYVSSFARVSWPGCADTWYLVGKGSQYRSSAYFSPSGVPEWKTGVHLARCDPPPAMHLEPAANDSRFDERLHWEIAVVADIQVTRDPADRVFLAVCDKGDGGHAEARIYDADQLSAWATTRTLAPLARMRTSLPAWLQLLTRDLDGDGDLVVFPSQAWWTDKTDDVVLRVMGMKGKP